LRYKIHLLTYLLTVVWKPQEVDPDKARPFTSHRPSFTRHCCFTVTRVSAVRYWLWLWVHGGVPSDPWCYGWDSLLSVWLCRVVFVQAVFFVD